MGLFANLFGKKPEKPVDETSAKTLYDEIQTLEQALEKEPSNISCQQQLMSKYSQATSVFAQAPSYRSQVDQALTRMNELRNMARSNF
ncbi:hypothetical protein J4N45_05240 [Vibrio sp. SCSIO 43140]|uniref:hypothetical protein n=1 Tax=Vibrio sp. SCSIO 43140 TaxID=2819100 RepID=UPI0020755DFC|nr:hypothetical protein [Vibrio sp. SCSIO 43140]USD61371.1 hypothetical protein J4N45_05240 [Vibrio sp. SCSIO 43140]